MTSETDPTAVAIVGIACRFPGAPNHRVFWRNLCEGVESITALSEDELAAAGVSAEALRNPLYVKAAPLLADADLFDAAFFEYSPQEARLMDPQQRLLLEVAWETFEDAGYPPGASTASVGVYVGSGGVVSSYLLDRLPNSAALPGDTGSLAHIANDKDFPSTRISYKLNLTGPSINVQTACSSSLVAVHLGCQAIVNGECDMALAGAATVRVPQRRGYLSMSGGILSPDGHCRAFDAAAQGTIFGSGVGLVLLKRLAAAIADGDNIYAVVRGSAVNNDGANKVSYTASSVAAQSKAMVEAMSLAGVSPDEIGYVECHGTGTILGDPLEIDALKRAFAVGTRRRGYCAIGSVKTNIGHLEQTAGIAALIKTALVLKNGQIPPSLHFKQPNPRIDFEDSPFFVNVDCRDWPVQARPRLAGVNCLGLGGTNAFAVLEEPPKAPVAAEAERLSQHLFTFSAKTSSGLRRSIEQHLDWMDSSARRDLGDLSFTLTSGRTHFQHRYAAVASSHEQLRSALADALKTTVSDRKPGEKRCLAFLFSGQGSQYVGMGAELYRSQPVFRATVDRCATVLRDRLERPLQEVLFGGSDATRSMLDETAYTQPALFAVQAALVDLWCSWGFVPDAVLGHSVGEFAAAYCAGVYTLEEALTLISDRARAMQALPKKGAMAAIFTDHTSVAAALESASTADVVIAAVNAPLSTVISGNAAAVSAIVDKFESQGVDCQRLRVSHAFHSPLMRPAIEGLDHIAEATMARAPRIAWISTLSGRPMTQAPDARYWCDHALNPVRFADAVRAMTGLGATDFVEIGPGNTLLALGRQCASQQCTSADAQSWLGSLGNRRGDWKELLLSLAELYSRGYGVDFDAFNRASRRRRISLPLYAFERQRFWLDDDRASRSPSSASLAADVSLTGKRLRSALAETQFEASFSLERLAYLDDHRIYGAAVLPMTAGLTALRDAARGHFGTDAVTIDNLQYREALVVPQTGETVVQTILSPVDEATAEGRLASESADKEGWRTHFVAMVRKEISTLSGEHAPLPLDEIRRRCPAPISTDRYYATLNAVGLEYGVSFRGIEELHRGSGEALARVRLPAHLPDSGSSLHPALLDACLHIYPALFEPYLDFDAASEHRRCTYLPVHFERFRGGLSGARQVWVHAARRPGRDNDGQRFTIDISIFGSDGTWVAALEGLSLKLLPPEMLEGESAAHKPEWLYQVRWDEQSAPSIATAGAEGAPAGWLILADRQGLGSALADSLRSAGGICRVVLLDDVRGCSADETWRKADSLRVHFKELISRLATESKAGLRGIVHLWALDTKTADATADEINCAQMTVLGTALSLFQAAVEVRERLDATLRIWLVTRNAVAASPADPPTEAVSAALWGFGRSAALEHPQIWGGLLDVGMGLERCASTDAAALTREILHGDGEDQVALRSARRFVPRLVRVPLPAAAEDAFDPTATYLITGGLGALGFEVANWLAGQRGAKHLLLVSRRGRDDPNADHVRSTLASLGAEVTIVQGDVTKETDLRRVLKNATGSGRRLKGIFHCAGLLDDGILLQMTWEKFERVMAPKVVGAWLLHELTLDCKLDHFVLFSSILSLTGSAGQANYTAANAFLDALAARRRRQQLPALVLNWGPWEESGLATQSGQKGRAIWRSRGTEYISLAMGCKALNSLIGADLSHAAITITSWPTFIGQFQSVPALYKELQKEMRPNAVSALPAAKAANVRSRLNETPKEHRRDLLIAFVAQEAMTTLGITEALDTARPLREFGLDSLMSVTLVNRLETGLGVKVSTANLMKGPSIEQLVNQIFPDLVETKDDSPATAPNGKSSAVPESGWLVALGRRSSPRYRLFCFPFAGGGSAIYRNWSQSLDAAIEVVAVEPPGRLGRIHETPVAHIEEFVDRLTCEMGDLLDRPFAFFGHCLGGLTMYETARRLMHSTEFRPCHLFASGARPPDQIDDLGPFEERLTHDLLKLKQFRLDVPPYAQSDEVFGEMVRHFNIRATEQLLEDAELQKLLLPTIRAEFKMASNYDYEAEPAWTIPITCFAGRDDPYVSREHALGWGRFTDSRFQMHIREGAHFAVVDDASFILEVINRELSGDKPQ